MCVGGGLIFSRKSNLIQRCMVKVKQQYVKEDKSYAMIMKIPKHATQETKEREITRKERKAEGNDSKKIVVYR